MQQNSTQECDGTLTREAEEPGAVHVRRNFVRFSVYFAAVPASALACLSLAVGKLGPEVGGTQSGILYAFYTLTGVTGLAQSFVQQCNSKRKAVLLGEVLLGGGYVACFAIALVLDSPWTALVAWVGAAVGGFGAAVLWTAQGVHFAHASSLLPADRRDSIDQLAAIFAGFLLAEETSLDITSTVLVQFLGLHWGAVFSVYWLVAICATYLTTTIDAYPRIASPPSVPEISLLDTISLWVTDIKLKYFLGFNVAFGFAGAFLNSFVSGAAVPLVTGRDSNIGMFVAWHGLVGAVVVLLQSRLPHSINMTIGCLAFSCMAVPFLFQNNVEAEWTWIHLFILYTLQGVGRATFEGTMKAVFAVYFAHNQPAAFANITLQNGVASTVAYLLPLLLVCSTQTDRECIRFSDGVSYNVKALATILLFSGLLGAAGFFRARSIYQREQLRRRPSGMQLATNRQSNKEYDEVAMTDKCDGLELPTLT